MKIYVCSPYDGLEENYFRAINYCRYVIEKGHTPICPVTMYHGVLQEKTTSDGERYGDLSRELAKVCDEIWVFGKIKTAEQQLTANFGKKIKYIKDIFNMKNSSETLSVLCRSFESLTGRTVNRGIADSILFFLNAGQSDGLILSAVKKAAKKNAGWNYAEGILKNCMAKGIATAEEFERDSPRPQESNISAYDLDVYEQMLNNKE